jgi:hypothetical protein
MGRERLTSLIRSSFEQRDRIYGGPSSKYRPAAEKSHRNGAHTRLLRGWRTLATLSFVSDSLFLKANKHMW